MATIAPLGLNRETGGFKEISAPDTLSAASIPEMLPASAGAAGYKGLVPTPSAGDQDKILKADKTWVDQYTHPTNHTPSIITQDTDNRFVTDTEKSTWTGKQDALGFTPEDSANKGTANGYASLGPDGKLLDSQLGAIAINEIYEVVDEAAQLALTVEKGDVAVRLDENKSYMAKNSNNASMGDWSLLRTPTDVVLSVDGFVGAVDLSNTYEPKNVNIQTTVTKVSGIAEGATANATDAQLRDRSTHTGTQSADSLTSGSTNKVFTATNKTKLEAIPQDKLNGVVEPLGTDDNTQGYSIGSRWIDVVAKKVYTCVNSSTGAASWVKNEVRNKFNATTAPTATNDNSEGFSVGSVWIDVSAKVAYTCVDGTDNNAVWGSGWGGGGGGGGGGDSPIEVSSFTGNGIATDFTMSEEPSSEQSLLITLDGIKQHTSAYSYSGTTLSFAAAPDNGVAIEVIYMRAGTSTNPNAASLDQSLIITSTPTFGGITIDTPTGTNDIIVGVDATSTQYGSVSLNGTHVTADRIGLAGGGDTNGVLYVDGKTGLEFRVGGSQKATINSSGDLTTTGNVNGRNISTDGSKLDGVAVNANNYIHPTSAGNKHVPAGGSADQYLKWSSSGVATWAASGNPFNQDLNTTDNVTFSSMTGIHYLVETGELGATNGITKHSSGPSMWYYGGSSSIMFKVGDGTGGERFYFGTDGIASKSSGAGDWSAISDQRLKTEISPFTDTALDKLTSLVPKKFKWINEAEHVATLKDQDGFCYGFMAQDVEAVFPFLVSHAPISEGSADASIITEDDAKATEMGYKDAYYIMALKELKDANAVLEARIEALEV